MVLRRRRRPEFDPYHVNDWFPVFEERRGRRQHPELPGWFVWSDPSPSPVGCGEGTVVVLDPSGGAHVVDLDRIPRDGRFHEVSSGGRVMPVRIGWYAGGSHTGYDSTGRWHRYTVAAGFYGCWT